MFKIKDYKINSILLWKAVRFFLKILLTSEPRDFFILENLYMGPGMVLSYFFLFSVFLNMMSLELDARGAEVV